MFSGYNGRIPILAVSDADLLSRICVKDFHHFADRFPWAAKFNDKFFNKFLTSLTGEDWKRVRCIITPTFSSRKLKRMVPLMDRCVSDLLDQIDQSLSRNTSAGTNDELNVKEAFSTYSLDIIARCAFAVRTASGSSDQSGTDSKDTLVKHAKSFFAPSMKRLLPLFFLPKWLTSLLGITFTGRACHDFFTQFFKAVITERRAQRASGSNRLPVDFVALMLEANERKPDTKPDHDIANLSTEEQEAHQRAFNQNPSGRSSLYIQDDEILAQACMFFVAGYETTSNALQYAVYCLANNPTIQERLFEELLQADPHLDGDPREIPDHETIFKCQYLDAVVNETLRLYTPSFQMDRIVTQEYTLPEPNSHVTLPKGMLVWLNYYALHHDPDYWLDPFKFDPDRFMPLNTAHIVPYSFMPFGVGPRSCVAARFALLEIKLALARVVLNYRFNCTESTPREPLTFVKFHNMLKSEKDIILGVQKR